MSSTSTRFLSDPQSITLVDHIEGDIDVAFIARVATPGQEVGMLYPVVAQEIEGNAGHWNMCPMDGFAHIPHIIQRLKYQSTRHVDTQGDMMVNILEGMLDKNNYDTASLVRATKASEFWRDNIYAALQECFAQSEIVYFVDYPSAHTEHSSIINRILFLTPDQRVDIEVLLNDYMVAYATWDTLDRNDNSRGRKQAALSEVVAKRIDLVEALDEFQDVTKVPNLDKDDHGVDYLSTPVLWETQSEKQDEDQDDIKE